MHAGYAEILSHDALAFLATLARMHRGRLATLLQVRRDNQARCDDGRLPGFLRSVPEAREPGWTIAPLPADLQDRRVEITGPVDRKMVINALNSGARCFMADFEDATSPTWTNLLDGQINLRDAVRGTITFEAPGKTYRLADRTAVLLVRPRGLHLPEAHVEIDGQPCPGSLFDFGLFLFHNARALLARGSGPYFYLPKLESHVEAGWWNDVFVQAQELLGLPIGTIKATVLVETLPASFQIEEILWQLRDHSAGLNCGRWDYIFSYIKTLRAHPEFLLPDRSEVGMTQPMMRAYTQRVIQVCHRRGAPAIGGMAANIPVKDDPAANEAAIAKVRADKLREVTDGHDGTWVAHPGLVPLATAIFDEHMPGPNQIARQREDVQVAAADLLRVPRGARTEQGVRHNLKVGVQYLAAWLAGSGCVPLYQLMEDAATAEISRAQLWQWARHGAALDDGRVVTPDLIRTLLAEELPGLPPGPTLGRAADLFLELVLARELAPFLTLAAYEEIVARSP
ncbi:MAG TPA: malate synthase A [Myxococcota bacterium]|nr:malate synthase A [Myxococcota bacterium]